MEPNVHGVPAFHCIDRPANECIVSLGTDGGQPVRDTIGRLV